MRLLTSLGLCLASVCTLMGCTSTERLIDVSLLNDSRAPIDERLDASRVIWDRVEQGELTQSRAQEMLKQIAWAPGTSPNLRLSAVRRLADSRADLADTERAFGLMLPTRIRPPFASLPEVRVMAETAAKNNWTSAAVPLVRAWSYPLGNDEERPERTALEQLFPDQSIEAVIWSVFSGEASDELRERDRRDAWGLLMRIDPNGSAVASLLDTQSRGGAVSDDPMVRTIQTARRVFGAIPSTSQQFEWADRINAPQHAAFRTNASRVLNSLGAQMSQQLAMRHASGVLWADVHQPDYLTLSRDELLAIATQVIEPRRQVWRDDPALGGASNESIDRNGEKLSWGDSLLTVIASGIPDETDLVSKIFRIADADKIEESTEFGGVIDARSDGRLEILSFPPRIRDRVNDERFVASLDMLRRGDTALFHYHLQAQRYRNGDYAGPSLADIQYAERQGRACIVFTFISRDELNADIYFPDGTTIDLGTMYRPGSVNGE